MKLKLTFKGPNVIATTTRREPLLIGNAISFEVELVGSAALTDLKRIWEMERTFNELTKGRLHVDLEDVADPEPRKETV